MVSTLRNILIELCANSFLSIFFRPPLLHGPSFSPLVCQFLLAKVKVNVLTFKLINSYLVNNFNYNYNKSQAYLQ